MAFNPVPTNVFAGWSEDATNVTLPLAAVPELTAAEADAVDGDSRKVVFALLEQMYQWYAALATADKPTKLQITRSSYVNESTGDIVRTYNVQTTLVPTGLEVSAE